MRTDLLLLLYGAPRRLVERRLTNLSLYLYLYCILLTHSDPPQTLWGDILVSNKKYVQLEAVVVASALDDM